MKAFSSHLNTLPPPALASAIASPRHWRVDDALDAGHLVAAVGQLERGFGKAQRKYACGAAYFRGQCRGTVRLNHGLDGAQRRLGSLVVEVKLSREVQAPSDSYEGDGFVMVRSPPTVVVQQALREIVKIVRVELG